MVVPIIDENHQSPHSMSPSAPPVEESGLSGNYIGGNTTPANPSDYIEFLVTQNNNVSSIVRASRNAILQSQTELSKLDTSSCPIRKIDGKYIVTGVEKDDFELLISYIETKFIKFRNTRHTLSILEVANRFVCSTLVILCVKDLDLNLNTENVIEIFRGLWYYNTITPPPKKSFVVTKQKNKKTSTTLAQQHVISAEEYISAMLKNCLQLIDMEAEEILLQSEIINFRFEELEMIAKRDALQIHSEMLLFDVLAKWSHRECERRGLDLNTDNRRRVLGGMCYYPRYLIMSVREFDQACNRVELLDAVEINLIREELKGKRMSNLSPEQRDMLLNFKNHRPPYAAMPIHLSERSNSKNYPKKMRRFERDKQEGCSSDCALNCFAILACIFD